MSSDDQTSTSAHKVASIDDLLIEILLRLPVYSLLLFKSVSKRWLSLINDSNFTRLRSKNLTPSGLFVSDRSEFAFVPFDVTKSPVITRFSFEWTFFIQSCNGLMLSFALPDYKFCVFNPTINRVKVIPAPRGWDQMRHISHWAMAFDPAVSPHYKVVYPRYNYDCPGFILDPIHIEFYSSETGKWSVSTQTFSSRLFRLFNNGVYWRDAIHWIDNSSREVLHLSIDDMNNPHFIQVRNPKTLYKGAYFHDKLAVSCDCLLRLQRIQPRSSLQMVVYEMKDDYFQWFIKYRANLNHITTGDFKLLPKKQYFKTQSIVLSGEGQEEPFLVLKVYGKLIRYNIISNTFDKLYDLPTARDHGTNLCSVLFNPSLARV